MNETLILRI